MSHSRKRRQVESTAVALQNRYGPSALFRAAEWESVPVPHIATGFATLDDLTGCGGIPLGAITLLSGQSTSGKLTTAYKLLANAQRSKRKRLYPVALLDLTRSSDPDYLTRAGVDLDHLLLLRPDPLATAADVLLEVAQEGRVRAVVLDSLPDLLDDREGRRRFQAVLRGIRRHLRAAGRCALLLLDEPSPPWQRWLNLDRSGVARSYASLHVELRRERWLLRSDGTLTGYAAQARLLKSRWTNRRANAPIDFYFNGTIRARETW